MTTLPCIDRNRLAEDVTCLGGAKVLLVGDVMLDEYLEGDAERISPEAPIPVVSVARSRLLLGGAGNVARNIAALGGETCLVSVCGCDAKGEMLQQLLDTEGIATRLTPLADRPTTLKTRVLARGQQMLRIDHEVAAPLAPAQTESLLSEVEAVIDAYHIVVISDYGKGVVNQDCMRGLAAIRARSRTKPRILIDPKPQNFSLYANAYILTPNTKETSEGAGRPAKTREDILAAGRIIFEKLGCEHLLTTLGDKGMALFLSQEEVWHIPTAARKVFDVTGAGDTVIATLALGLAAGLDLLDACVLANYAAGVVVGDVGASVVSAAVLRQVVEAAPDPGISRWLP